MYRYLGVIAFSNLAFSDVMKAMSVSSVSVTGAEKMSDP